MNTRYHIQVDGEAEPRGPLPAAAVRRMITNGEISGGTPACLEGDTAWLTLDDYWDVIHEEVTPAVRAASVRSFPVPIVRAASPVVREVEHPALRPPPPLPVWRIVYGVCFLVGSFSTLGWAVLALTSAMATPMGDKMSFLIVALITFVVQFALGVALTSRPPRKLDDGR